MMNNTSSTTNSDWLRHMKVGRSYVRYYDTRKLLHSAQSCISRFNKGIGRSMDIFLSTRTTTLKRNGAGRAFKLNVNCMSNKKHSTAYEPEPSW